MNHLNCPRCNAEVIAKARFCPSCGFRFEMENADEAKTHSYVDARKALLLYFILLAVCAFLKFAKIPASYHVLGMAEIIICLSILFFAFSDRKELAPVVFNKNVRWWIFPLLAIGACLANIGVSYLVDFINRLNDDIFFSYMYEDTSHPLLWSIIFIAIQPAIFEELAFRGVIYNRLEKTMDPNSVLVVSGLSFAVLHLSPVSIIWLLPFGFFVAWLRKKSGHIWYGIAFHFFFNLTYVLIESWHRGLLK